MPRRKPSHEDNPGVRRFHRLFSRKRGFKQAASKSDRAEPKLVEIALDDELKKRAFSDPQSFT